jgi:hypothetical protein
MTDPTEIAEVTRRIRERDERVAAQLPRDLPPGNYTVYVDDDGNVTRVEGGPLAELRARRHKTAVEEADMDFLECGHPDRGFSECGICGESGTEAEGPVPDPDPEPEDDYDPVAAFFEDVPLNPEQERRLEQLRRVRERNDAHDETGSLSEDEEQHRSEWPR